MGRKNRRETQQTTVQVMCSLLHVKVSKIKVINVQAMCSLAVRIRKPIILGPGSVLKSI
jgi:hypothetical protein